MHILRIILLVLSRGKYFRDGPQLFLVRVAADLLLFNANAGWFAHGSLQPPTQRLGLPVYPLLTCYRTSVLL
jgi:hypothetical protein